ncbi:hypothetical protein MRB53_039829 [Persea americana]|nr:hypothetical protein MRB53_039829 [Persea americana]
MSAFKVPGLPDNKRKLQSQDPTQVHKSVKLQRNGDAKGRLHKPVVVEQIPDEQSQDDGAAGPDLPPADGDDDDDEAGAEDEEGRFFGAGISKDTTDVLDYLDERDEQGYKAEKIDAPWVRRFAGNFEKHISRNAELRAKFEDEPQRFLESEAALDKDILGLSILTDHAGLYGELAESGCADSLASLLAHENTDIVIDAIEIIDELTDEDVDVEQVQWDALAKRLLDADLPNLLIQNLARLNESEESSRNAVYHILGIVENFASRPAVSASLCESVPLLQWLLMRMQRKEAGSSFSQNKQYSCEVLGILLQTFEKARQSIVKMDGVDTILQLLAQYRKTDPLRNSLEEEYAENLFDCLTCLVDSDDAKADFVKAEGVELCLIMLRDSSFSKPRALRVMNHAINGYGGIECCERFADDDHGLQAIFSILQKSSDATMVEHVLGCIVSLFKALPGESPARIRLLIKCTEKKQRHIRKLVQIRRRYRQKLQQVDRSEEADVLARLDAGLYQYQTIDLILAFLVAEDDETKQSIVALLQSEDAGQSLADVKATLQEQLTDLRRGSETESLTPEDAHTADMLGTLIAFCE